ncbi:hypothetical protein [Micromonospora harpali]|uniref:Uncharacterized protein n=1 Tax=Micromonospora harpali TaxID=1490225 RepID=A0ABW1HNE4_9ACTN
MTAPFLSLAQIRNRLVLTARWVLRCPICQRSGCAVAAAARDVIDAAGEVRQRSAAIRPAAPDRDDPQQTG